MEIFKLLICVCTHECHGKVPIEESEDEPSDIGTTYPIIMGYNDLYTEEKHYH